jgi:hypothetical protein|tara:strand:+ start:105 stop:737 length:633 start_codon:yes stop_codon:yes gene_type:complete
MNSKTLSGWMLTVAPILFVLILFIAWPAVIGEADTSAENVDLMLAKPMFTSIFTLLGIIIFGSMSMGFTLLAWSRADGATTEGTLASIASVIFVGVTSIIFIGLGLTYPILGEGADNLPEAAMLMAVSDSMFAAVMIAWTLGNIILGAALIIENKINRIASGLLLLSGILLFIMHILVGSDISLEVIWIIPFLSAPVSALVLGIFSLRSE